MRVFIDESGDPHPSGNSKCFAVGAVVVEDESPVEDLLNSVAGAFGDPSLPFHATADSADFRNALWNGLDSSDLKLHFRAVAFDISQMPDTQDAKSVHRRALGHVLSLIPFCPPDTHVEISERAQSFTQADVASLYQLGQDARWETLLSIPDLRKADFSEPPIDVVQGTPSRGLQLCDHILWRWQRSIRNPADEIEWPRKSLLVWQHPPLQLQHFQASNFMRGGSPLFDAIAEFSRSRLALPNPKGSPLADSYGCLAHNHENGGQLSDSDHALNRLLLHSEDSEVFTDESVSQVCYSILEGRTRWPYWFPITNDDFGLYAAVGAYHIGVGSLGHTAKLPSFDAVRMRIRDFREQVRAAMNRLQDK